MEEEEEEEINYIYYGDFDWLDYMNTKPYLTLKTKEQIYHEYVKEEGSKGIPLYFSISSNNSKDNSCNLFTLNNLNIGYDNFQWKSYLLLNTDLKRAGINTKENAWEHWINYGKKGERAFSLINNTNNHKGRLGNIFFANMYLHFLALKYQLKCNYKHKRQFNNLGISFYSGKHIYNKNVLITRFNYLSILEKENHEPCNIISITKNWFQSKPFCLLLQDYFKKEEIRKEIMNKNIFKSRYGKNNDLFLHIRLGDVSDRIQVLYSYFEKMLINLPYENAYVSSDSINSTFCKKLIEKYNLIVIDKNEIETIMFANTCKYIVLTGGTFSWLLGFFAFFVKGIYYPKLENKWFGQIFDFSNWICVSVF